MSELEEYKRGFYDCKRAILGILSGFFSALYPEEWWEKSSLKKVIESIELKQKDMEQ